jgi:hypothetical protein
VGRSPAGPVLAVPDDQTALALSQDGSNRDEPTYLLVLVSARLILSAAESESTDGYERSL